MEVDPEQSDTLMHLSGYIFLVAINAALRGKGPNSRTWKRESVAVHLSHPLVIPHIIPPPLFLLLPSILRHPRSRAGISCRGRSASAK